MIAPGIRVNIRGIISDTTNTATARAATRIGAIPLRKLQLIGVMGTPKARRALLRSSAGQIRQITVGDTLRQGTVITISDTAVYLSTGTGQQVLAMPALPDTQTAA